MSDRRGDIDDACWRYIVGIYAHRDAATACLALQDGFGADVPLLMFLAWLAAKRGIAIDVSRAEALRTLVEPWQREVVTGLRRIRRDIKRSDWAHQPEVAAFRDDVKGLELRAERLEIGALSRWLEAHAVGLPTNGSVEHNLAIYVGAIAPDRPATEIDAAIQPIVDACRLGPDLT